SGQGCDLSQRHARQERRRDGPYAHREERAGRCLLVDQPLQRRGLFREERLSRVFDQQLDCEEERRRLDHGPVRWLRRQGPELPAEHAGLELQGAVVSPARRDPERKVEIPGSAATMTWHPGPATSV